MCDLQAPINAFIFDLFGVVIGFDNNIVYSRLAPHCTAPHTAAQRLQGLMASRDVVTGKLTLADIHRQLIDSHGLMLSYADFEAAWLAPYSWPMPGMVNVITLLASHYRLILLSNIDRYYWQVARALHPELELFDVLLLSCDLGLAKPEPEIFHRACSIAGIEPSECLFIDDTQVNVQAATSVGLQTHWFQGVSAFGRCLRSAGIQQVDALI